LIRIDLRRDLNLKRFKVRDLNDIRISQTSQIIAEHENQNPQEPVRRHGRASAD
jgi:hypothetical protein